MKIALIDHPFHKKTKSTVFIQELLEKVGEVDLHWEENWWTGKGIMDLAPIINGNYDLVVCLQTEFLAPFLLRHHDNVIIIPMYDGAVQWNDGFWKQCTRARVISFCRTMHEKIIGIGCDSYYFKFAPDPYKFKPVENYDTLQAFFWERLPDSKIDSNFVVKMLEKTSVEKLHIHQVPDAGIKNPISTPKNMQVTTSEWFEEYTEFLDLMNNSNVFVQPREYEGIGKAFLEAMAMGQCVISPGFPTMSEYITNAVNGLLFSPASVPNFELLKPKFAKKMGQNARFTIERVHEEWLASEQRFLDIVSSPKGTGKLREGFIYDKSLEKKVKTQIKPKTKRRKNPRIKKGRITVATVVFNAESDIKRTIESVSKLAYPDVEFIVMDGGSTDDTLKTIKSHSKAIDYWRSEPDLGPFDAMNKAAEYASGEYIIFLNAGDTFYGDKVLESALKITEITNNRPDVIFGHHFWKRKNGVIERKTAKSFDETWGRLMYGNIDLNWLKGMPCHQSTLTKTAFLRANPYNLSFHLAADHEFLFRAKKNGAVIEHCNCSIGVYEEGGLTSQNFQRLNVEWYDIAKIYSPDNESVDKLYKVATGFKALDYVPNSDKVQKVLEKELNHEHLKYKVARKLKNYPMLFEAARRTYKMIDKK